MFPLIQKMGYDTVSEMEPLDKTHLSIDTIDKKMGYDP